MGLVTWDILKSVDDAELSRANWARTLAEGDREYFATSTINF
jgi:hypothetical protein